MSCGGSHHGFFINTEKWTKFVLDHPMILHAVYIQSSLKFLGTLILCTHGLWEEDISAKQTAELA